MIFKVVFLTDLFPNGGPIKLQSKKGKPRLLESVKFQLRPQNQALETKSIIDTLRARNNCNMPIDQTSKVNRYLIIKFSFYFLPKTKQEIP